MTLFAVMNSSSDPVALCLSVLLMSKAHCTDRRLCVLLSLLLYAWFLEVPISAELCVPAFLGWLFPCFPPKGEQYWAEQKESLHRWIASNCTKECPRPKRTAPKKGPPCQDGEQAMAVLLKNLKATRRWTAEDDQRADAAIAAKGAPGSSAPGSSTEASVSAQLAKKEIGVELIIDLCNFLLTNQGQLPRQRAPQNTPERSLHTALYNNVRRKGRSSLPAIIEPLTQRAAQECLQFRAFAEKPELQWLKERLGTHAAEYCSLPLGNQRPWSTTVHWLEERWRHLLAERLFTDDLALWTLEGRGAERPAARRVVQLYKGNTAADERT